MSITWYLLGLNSRDQLELGKGRPEWWTGADADAFKFHQFADITFDTQNCRLSYWSDSDKHRIGGRLPEMWARLLIERFRAANPSGLRLVNVNDIWQGPDDHSPLALPGEDPQSERFLPIIAFYDTDPDFALLLKYLPELSDSGVVAQIIKEMRARGTGVRRVGA
jgi:hypothetical protein